MDYKALYRKFRPRVFEEVVGQSHVTNTLKNQIVTENVAHAYLFSGIRGTGKTSTAKIFARALNCTDSKDGNPCNECENCLTALSDNAIDIIEIDAASNNGVDDIRDLREKTKYPPSKMKYKVYIIDEVHMLSIGAFNALLKTLEEPPSYIIFIFATTEIHKIPATIISRCQKYELKRIMLNDIEQLMQGICDASGFTYDQQALEQIARLSEGAARDSLSILDQCFAANSSKHISIDVLTDVLGLVTEEVIFNIIEGIYKQDSKTILLNLNDIIKSGKDIKRFTNQLIEYMRYLMLAKISTDLSDLINVSPESLSLIVEHSKQLSLSLMTRSLNILTQVEIDSKWSGNPRVILEVGLIKVLQPDLEDSIEALMQRIEQLESQPVVRAVPQIQTKVEPVSQPQKTPLAEDTVEVKTTTETEVIEQAVVDETPEVIEAVYESTETLSSDVNELEDLWEDVLELVKKVKISTHALLVDGKFEGIVDNALCISYKDGYGFHMIAIEKPDNRTIVENAIERIYGKAIRVKYIIKNDEEDQSVVSEQDEEDQLFEFLGEHKNKLEFQD